MSRIALVVALAGLAGCDLLFQLQSVETHDGGALGDGVADDGHASGPHALCPVLPPFASQTDTTTPVVSYTTGNGIAVYDDRTGTIKQTTAGAVAGSTILVGITGATLGQPKLAPDGTRLLLHLAAGISPAAVIESTAAGAGVWTPSMAVMMTLSTGIFTGNPGTPSDGVGGEVRMVVDLGGNVFVELGEVSPGSWTERHRYPLGTFSNLSQMGEPSLTTDGLHLVMVGTSSGTTEIFRVDRTSLDVAFPMQQAVAIYNDTNPGNEQTPFLDATCSTLYWSNATDLHLHHAP